MSITLDNVEQRPKIKNDIGLSPEHMKLWLKDVIRGIIPTGGRCAHGCVYCILKSNKHSISSTSWINFISEEDLEYGLSLLCHVEKIDDRITNLDIGSGGRIIQSEPWFHPNYISLLKIVRKYFPDIPISSTTLARWIPTDSYSILRDLKWQAHVTLNSFKEDLRKNMMPGLDDIEGLKLFLENDDLVHQFFLVWHGDMDAYKKDIDTLFKINPKLIEKPISTWPVAYTDVTFNTPGVYDLWMQGQKNFKDMLEWSEKQGLKMNPTFWTCDDSLKLYGSADYNNYHFNRQNFDKRINGAIKKINNMDIDINNVAFMLSDSVWSYSEKYNNMIHRINVKNITFGGNVIVAGLLTHKDFINAIAENKPYKYYAIPNEVFIYYEEDVSYTKIKDYKFNYILV